VGELAGDDPSKNRSQIKKCFGVSRWCSSNGLVAAFLIRRYPIWRQLRKHGTVAVPATQVGSEANAAYLP
jgi:hypothetical protein